MKDYFQIPLFFIAVVIVLLVVGNSLAQSNNRSSRSGLSSRSFDRDTSSSRNVSSTRGRGSSNRSRQGREALELDETEEPLSQEAQAAIEELNIIQNKITANRKQIDQLFREMPIGFDNAQVTKQKQIDMAKERAKVLNNEMIEQGIKIFRLAPMQERRSTNIVLAKLFDSLNPTSPESKFDPKTAMEISKLILTQERVPWKILMKAFMASYAVHDFEQASMILDRLEETAPVKDVYYEVLEKTSQAWQEEQLIRRLETATGDLPYAIVETTEGKFKIELFENQATLTVYDFISRAEGGLGASGKIRASWLVA